MKKVGEYCEPSKSQWQTWQRVAPMRLPVRFVPDSPLQLKIKYDQAMKTSAPVQNDKPMISSLFQIASRFETFADADVPQSASSLHMISFADLMLHPETVEEVLKGTRPADPAASPIPITRRRTRKAPPTVTGRNGNEETARRSQCKLNTAEFFLDAPGAKSVKLAGDFTDWGKSPLDLTKLAGEIWHAAVSLPTGYHSYRFIVDGQWCDDPLSVLRVPNPFGSTNAVTIVAESKHE